MKKYLITLTVLVASISIASIFSEKAQAQPLTANMQTTATLAGSCIINAQSINVGNVVGGQASATGTGQLAVQCTKGTKYSFSLAFPTDGTDCPYMTGQASGDKLYYGVVINGQIADLYDPINSTGIGSQQTWTMTGMVSPPASLWDSQNVCKNRTSVYNGINPFVTPDSYSQNVSAQLTF
jgi:hypothetical protein